MPRVPPYALQRYKHGIGEVASGIVLVGIQYVRSKFTPLINCFNHSWSWFGMLPRTKITI